MSLPGYDAWLHGGTGGPDEDTGPDYACTQDEFNAVEKAHEELGGIVFSPDLPDDIVKAINDARQIMADWMQSSEDQGIAPSNDPADRHGV